MICRIQPPCSDNAPVRLVILCFCAFDDSLEASEIKGLKNIVKAGRDFPEVGMSVNPLLILTARELFGQFHFGEFSELYETQAKN